MKLKKIQIRVHEKDVEFAKRLAKKSGRYYHEILREAISKGLFKIWLE